MAVNIFLKCNEEGTWQAGWESLLHACIDEGSNAQLVVH